MAAACKGIIGDFQAVVLLVAAADTSQDLDGVFQRRLFDQDGLEAPFQGGVALDVLAVIVQGGGADDLDLAAGQRRLQDIGGVHGALGGAGADHGVELVDEDDDIADGAQLLEDLLQALLELAAVLGAGHQGGDVQGNQALAFQRLRDVGGDDSMGQPFDDGSLADAGLADESGIVLGAAGQDLDDPLDLLGAADDRVELVGPGGGGQVDRNGVQVGRLAGGFAGLGRRRTAATSRPGLKPW